MKYSESQLDKELRQRFANDFSQAYLRNINLLKGKLRGINKLNITFTYPITAIAGANGSGKSTILALACCAYHNYTTGFKLSRRVNNYYTFSDFFVQHKEELTPAGIEIQYMFAHNNWKGSENENRFGYQVRRKAQGGKWNDYDVRIKKNVLFLGIERIVPHSERSQSRSYSKSFLATKEKGWEDKVRQIVGQILGKDYKKFRYLEHSKYSLPIVECEGVIYSGFNMGAGENALFEIFSTIYRSGPNTILVLDEIELGLHAKAQSIFMKKLKEVCKETKLQVICTTHSKEIFDCLPDDARIFLENLNGKSKTSIGVSSEFAFSRMGLKVPAELDIFVEDDVARSLVQSCLTGSLRSRVGIYVIGSGAAVARQMAAAYVKDPNHQCLAVFDGDQRIKQALNIDHAWKMSEVSSKTEFEAWLTPRIAYLPGDTWPENWMIQKSKENVNTAAGMFGVESDEMQNYLEYALGAGKHNEFHELAKHVHVDKGQAMDRLAIALTTECAAEFTELVQKINHHLL